MALGERQAFGLEKCDMRNRLALRYGMAAVLMAVLVAGCSRDPEREKKAYFDSGTRYFQNEKYREAAIQFQNAIKIDPAFADAHYQLAQCYAKSKIWNQAYAELMRAVDLAPNNYKARIDLGNVHLAARDFTKAEDQANIVLGAEPNNVDAHTLLAEALAVEGKGE